jgi:hypothetical protein
MVEEGDS